MFKTNQESPFDIHTTHLPTPPHFSSLEAICKIIVYGIWLPPTISTSKCFWFRRWLISLFSKNGNETSNLSEEEAQQTTTKERPLTHRPYISGFANTLDVISIISYWVDFGLMIHGYPYCSLFKAIGASRPLRLAMIFKGTAVCGSCMVVYSHTKVLIIILH